MSCSLIPSAYKVFFNIYIPITKHPVAEQNLYPTHIQCIVITLYKKKKTLSSNTTKRIVYSITYHQYIGGVCILFFFFLCVMKYKTP